MDPHSTRFDRLAQQLADFVCSTHAASVAVAAGHTDTQAENAATDEASLFELQAVLRTVSG